MVLRSIERKEKGIKKADLQHHGRRKEKSLGGEGRIATVHGFCRKEPQVCSGKKKEKRRGTAGEGKLTDAKASGCSSDALKRDKKRGGRRKTSRALAPEERAKKGWGTC